MTSHCCMFGREEETVERKNRYEKGSKILFSQNKGIRENKMGSISWFNPNKVRQVGFSTNHSSQPRKEKKEKRKNERKKKSKENEKRKKRRKR